MDKFWSDKAWDDYLYWQAQDKRTLRRINKLIKNGRYYLIRCKDVNAKRLLGEDFPCGVDEFDCTVHRILTRTQSKKRWAQPEKGDEYRVICKDVAFDYIKDGVGQEYGMDIRIVRVRLDGGSYVNIVTNLPSKEFSAKELRELYHMRWGIETSFRELKHTIGAIAFHSRKVEYIKQEIWARLILYNFCTIVTGHVVIIAKKDTRHEYQVNFTMAMKVCIHFVRLRPERPPPDVEALIGTYVLPVRPDRQYPRQKRFQLPVSFTYRFS